MKMNFKIVLTPKADMYSVFSIGRADRFGFSQTRFSKKVPWRNVWIAVALAVMGRERVGVLPGKRCGFSGPGGM